MPKKVPRTPSTIQEASTRSSPPSPPRSLTVHLGCNRMMAALTTAKRSPLRRLRVRYCKSASKDPTTTSAKAARASLVLIESLTSNSVGRTRLPSGLRAGEYRKITMAPFPTCDNFTGQSSTQFDNDPSDAVDVPAPIRSRSPIEGRNRRCSYSKDIQGPFPHLVSPQMGRCSRAAARVVRFNFGIHLRTPAF